MKHQLTLIKKIIWGGAMLVFTLGLSACDENEAESAVLSNEEAALIIEGALANGSQGITSEVNDVIYLSLEYAQKNGNNEYCGITSDTTVTRNINETRITANYTSTWTWLLNCNNLRLPTSLDFNLTSNGEYETARMLSEDNSSSDWSVSNLLTGTAYTLTGTYTRAGNQTSKIRDQNSFTSDVNINIITLTVNKNTLRIDSGTATFTLTGSGTGGNTFSYQGSITFLGNGKATIMINGQTFEVDLN